MANDGDDDTLHFHVQRCSPAAASNLTAYILGLTAHVPFLAVNWARIKLSIHDFINGKTAQASQVDATSISTVVVTGGF